MSLLGTREARDVERWSAVLRALLDGPDHAARLDAALGHVRAAAGTAAAHLYLADDAGRLLLERSIGTTEPARGGRISRDDVPLLAEDDPSGDAPLELRFDAEADERTVSVPAGRFHAVPIGAAGHPSGVVLAGPLAGTALPRAERRNVEALAVPLEAVAISSRREHELRCRLSAVEAREHVGRRLASSAIEPARYVELLLEIALRATGAEGGFVAMAADDRTLEVRARAGLDAELERLDLSPESGIFDWSPAQEGGALIVEDVEAVMRLGLRSLLAVPLLDGARPLGVFAVADRGGGRPLDPRALDILSTFARQIESMLRNERVYREFADAYVASLRGLAAALDERRPDTRGHHAAVRRIALAIGGRIGLDDEESKSLGLAASLHDVGLAGVAGSEHAFEVDQEHPTIGAGMIEHLPLSPLIGDAVACHHEWHDGWGFPCGLRGDEIPRIGRVLAAAEFIAEMQAGTALRAPWDADRLRSELGRRSGTQFDPVVSDAAAAVLAVAPA